MPALYLVPIANIPSNPGYTVHYYTWGSGTPLARSTMAPSPLPNMTTHFVACVVLQVNPPTGAVVMGGNKDEPPPPNAFSPLTDLESFKKELEAIIEDQRVP